MSTAIRAVIAVAILLNGAIAIATPAATIAMSSEQAAASSAPNTSTDAFNQDVRRSRLDAFNPAVPEAPKIHGTTDHQTEQEYNLALRAYYAYRVRGYEHRLQVFEWQSWSSKAIFFVVLALVFAGIVFAALQFRAGMQNPKGASEAMTEFVFDFKGIQVRSPVLGVIILVLSLAFFYLYLMQVYPIISVF